MLYKDYKDESYFTQAYFLLLTIRNLCFGLIMGLLFANPIPQVSLLIVLNVLTMLYLAFKRPFINIFMVIQQFVFETDLLLSNICFLIMAILDSNGSSSKQTRFVLGEIILKAIFATKFIPLITLIPKIVLILIKIYKDRQAKKNAAKAPATAEPETAALCSPPDVNVADQQQKAGEKEVVSPHADEKDPILEGRTSSRSPERRPSQLHNHNALESPQANNEKEVNNTESYQDCDFSSEGRDNSIHIMQMDIPKNMWQGPRK